MMKSHSQAVAAVAALALLAGTAVKAQQVTSGEERRRVEASQVRTVLPVRVPMEASIVKGAPYFAEVVIESIQQLPDGNRITNQTTGRVYRDSEGRIRREEDRAPGQVGTISITDPVARVSVALDPASKTAWKTATATARALAGRGGGRGGFVARPSDSQDPAELERKRRLEAEIAGGTARTAAAMPPPPPPAPAPGAPAGMIRRSGGPAWEEKTESLPARQIEGVQAEGRRTTRTIPAGAIGNEQPLVITSEEWISPELKVLVMTRTFDPRTGESTYRLVNITRSEPDASWFEVPADYTIRDSGVSRLAPVQRPQ